MNSSSLTTVSVIPELEVDWEAWVENAQPNRDPESYAEAAANIPSPTDEDPWRATWPSKTHPPFGIFGSVPGPVASSLTAVGDQPVKYSQRTLCVEYKDKEYAAMVKEFKNFDPIAFARNIRFHNEYEHRPGGQANLHEAARNAQSCVRCIARPCSETPEVVENSMRGDASHV